MSEARRDRRGLASTWHAALQKEMGNARELFDVLVWAASGSNHRRPVLLAQLYRCVGQGLERAVLNLAAGHATDLASYDIFEPSADGNLDRLTSAYWEGIGQRVTETPQFLSFAPDKSRVGSVGMMCSPIWAPGNVLGWACPQDIRSDGLKVQRGGTG